MNATFRLLARASSALACWVPAFACLAQAAPATRPAAAHAASWTADNGNGTYSNPLFYEEFSDPDVIRVGDDYYMAGTTNHMSPGLPILHSKDLVNWTLASYCVDRLDFGPKFALTGGDIYGGGIWAPCLRYHDGTFYVFSNINGVGTQVYRSKSPNGPWRHNALKTTLYDLGVLFDDDGKIWAFHGTEPIYLTQLNAALTDVVPNTKRLLIPARSGMGEGLHAYKIKGQYFLISAVPGAHTNLVCARADTLAGPWTVEPLTDLENMGVPTDPALKVTGDPAHPQFERIERDPNTGGGLTIHQGGIVDTPSGQWWSILMTDHGSVGRLSSLVPVTWIDGWPRVGLPGNPGKAPGTWVKPDTGATGVTPKPLFERDDDFNSGKLKPIWQWNHLPDDAKWSITHGKLRLRALPAADFFTARNTLTQRAIGPQSTVTVELDAAGLKPGDVAGLGLLNWPYATLGVTHENGQFVLRHFDQFAGKTTDQPLEGPKVWLRAACNFDTQVAQFSFSKDGKRWQDIGGPFQMLFQLRTFQGVRYTLFNYSTAGPAGFADFDNFTVAEPNPSALTTPIPYGKRIALTTRAGNYAVKVDGDAVVAAAAGETPTPFAVENAGPGQISLKSPDGRYLAVADEGHRVVLQADAGATFQWVDLQRGDLLLMALGNHRYLFAKPANPGPLRADVAGPRPDRRGGAAFAWSQVRP